jgi:hypothetical protein
MSNPIETDDGIDTNVVDQLPAEDGADAPSVQRSQQNLLDRLLYKGVLPRYAFPTDVVSFYIFDRENSTRHDTKYRYAPSQGLPVALTQYAPGKVVWVDGKEWKSGAIYSPFKTELFEAWRDRWIYFECQVCHYALHLPKDQADPGEERDCPACSAEGRFGKAMNWMRPPGFAHPVGKDPGTSPDDAPARSYATRAKLVAEGPVDASKWQHLTGGLQQTFRRDTLLVTNTGPRGEGYSYCTLCVLIEPTALATGGVSGTHKKPYPDEQDPDCKGERSTRGLVLGTDFISDVLLVRLTVKPPLTLRPELLPTQVALRTIAEALTIAATDRLEIEATEVQAEFRPALTHRVNDGLEAEIYLYDTLAGGAGFTQRISTFGVSIFEDTLKRLEKCEANCDESCYRCLRSFRNRFEHSQLDRRVGASLLRYLLYGELPVLDQERLKQSANRLFADVESRGVEGVMFERNVVVPIEGIGDVEAPILATRGNQRWIFAIHGPLTRDLAPTPELNDAKEYGTIPVHLIDDMVISRNLPKASEQVRKWLT